jgi:hypothetical protein
MKAEPAYENLIKKRIVTRTTEIFLDESGILHIKMLDNARVEIEDVAFNHMAMWALTKGKPALELIDSTVKYFVTSDASDYIIKKNTTERTLARAIIVDSFLSQSTRYLFVRFCNSPLPTKIFITKEAGLAWLRSFLPAVVLEFYYYF